jgi:hypothetical protein
MWRQDDMRVLAHFYTFEHFMDPVLDNYIKRFVRDFIHYRDEVGRPCRQLYAVPSHLLGGLYAAPSLLRGRKRSLS